MKGTIKKAICMSFVSSTAFNVQAATVVCSGTVEQISYHQPGVLYVRLSNMNVPVAICSLNTEWVQPGSMSGTTPVESCKAIFAALLAAKHAGTHIGMMYFDGDQVPATCGAFASWTKANVRYFDS